MRPWPGRKATWPRTGTRQRTGASPIGREGAQHLIRSLTAKRGGGVKRPASSSAWEPNGRTRPASLGASVILAGRAKRWTDETHAYNILVMSWPQIRTKVTRFAADVPEQTDFGFSGGEAP